MLLGDVQEIEARYRPMSTRQVVSQSDADVLRLCTALIQALQENDTLRYVHQEHESLLTLLLQTFGYEQLWCARGQWILQRPGKPGYIECMPLSQALTGAL